jgi:hypothetical protein
MTDPSRRKVAALLASVAAWPGSAMAAALGRSDPPKSPQAMLLSVFEHRQSACAIGARCLKSLSPGQTAHGLTEAIAAAVGLDAETLKTRPAVKRRIAHQVARDFAEGAVVNVDGWMLSLTEARLCALAALSREGMA